MCCLAHCVLPWAPYCPPPQGTDAFVRQPYHQLRHPMIFYYCHPAVLYVNKFRVAGVLTEGVDSRMEQVRHVSEGLAGCSVTGQYDGSGE